jgi:hypothetical protein
MQHDPLSHFLFRYQHKHYFYKGVENRRKIRINTSSKGLWLGKSTLFRWYKLETKKCGHGLKT